MMPLPLPLLPAEVVSDSASFIPFGRSSGDVNHKFLSVARYFFYFILENQRSILFISEFTSHSLLRETLCSFLRQVCCPPHGGTG